MYIYTYTNTCVCMYKSIILYFKYTYKFGRYNMYTLLNLCNDTNALLKIKRVRDSTLAVKDSIFL